jgi:hypothetical protein
MRSGIPIHYKSNLRKRYRSMSESNIKYNIKENDFKLIKSENNIKINDETIYMKDIFIIIGAALYNESIDILFSDDK